jgi:DNA-directed RNA polymerase II subunit RPB1
MCVCRNQLDDEYRQLRDDLNIMRMETLTHGNGGINIPVNLRRLIWNAQTHYNCGPHKVPPPGELRAVEIVQRVKV